MTDTLTFTQPFWLFLLIALVPLLVLRTRSQRFREIAVTALVAPRLRNRLLIGERAGAHWGRFTLQLLALACLLLALAGPRYGFTEEETFAEGRNVLIGIDTSRSMLANDLKPNRIERAKLAAIDLIGTLPSDRIGLIAFAGTSFLQAPLTVDHEAVIESLTHLDTEVIPRGGTNISRAITLARDTFKDAKSANNAIILFTDGEDLEGSESLEKFKEQMDDVEMTVVSIGVGTSLGAIIPDPDPGSAGDFIRDNEGTIVRSRLEDAALKSLARQSNGLYLNLNSTAAMQTVVKQALDRLEKAALEGRTIHKPIDRFRWALIPGIGFLLLSLVPRDGATSRRRVEKRNAGATTTAATTIIALLLAAPALVASDAADAADAYRKYKEGAYEEAVEAYEERLEKPNLDPADELQYGAASAAFKMGDFQKAIESYGEALLSRKPAVQEKSHYSLGNALYREGEARIENPEDTVNHWRNAVSHYEAALALNETNEDTRFNLDFVKKRLEELEKQQQQQQQQQEDQEKQQKGQSDQNQENSQNQKGDQNQESQQKSDSEENQGEDSSGSEDQQQDEKEEQDGNQKQDQDQQGGEDEREAEKQPETPEGELEAKENPAEPKPSERRGGEEETPNPETGFTRSQARQILRSLADEDLEVRPLVPPSGERVFKNW